MQKIAILGATGYIGKSLLQEFFVSKNKYQLFLFSRSKSKIKNTIDDLVSVPDTSIHSYDEFYSYKYDVVINCTGVGYPSVLKEDPYSIFKITEEIDTMVLEYLVKRPKTVYINLSSGAVYGDNFKKTINTTTKSIININNLKVSEYYAIAKINAEAKHRSLPHLHIVDIRVFAFFSRFLDTKVEFLMSDIVSCLQNGEMFKTSNEDIIRDYVISQDLFSLICLIMKKRKMNDFFDLYSQKPISKLKLLEGLKKKFGLQYSFLKNQDVQKNIVFKKFYYSKNKKAESIGYVPKFTSLQGIEYEIDKFLKNRI